MNNEIDIIAENMPIPEVPEVFEEPVIEVPAEAVEAEEPAVEAEEIAAEAEEIVVEAEEIAVEAEEIAVEAEEIAEDEEPVVAIPFDEDEEFIPPITFSDDYDDPVDDSEFDYYQSNSARVRIHLTEKEEEKKPEPVVRKVSLWGKIQNAVYHNKTAILIGAGVVALAVLLVISRSMA